MTEIKRETDSTYTGPGWQVVEKKKATFRPQTFTSHAGQSLVGALRTLPRNSPVWSKFSKFLRKVHIDCDVKKFQDLVRGAGNDVEFLKTLKKRIAYPEKKKEEKKETTARGSAAQEQSHQTGTDAGHRHRKKLEGPVAESPTSKSSSNRSKESSSTILISDAPRAKLRPRCQRI